jgi:NAD(P)-dependent dehydrogenase (short-subunit alcohol dehydrogenase family)
VSSAQEEDLSMAAHPRSLVGRVAVVTGGGRGIGLAIARALAREGARVAIGDVDVTAAERAAAELGGGAVALPLDVTDRPGYTAFLDAVEERLGPLEILVNNAGIMPVTALADEDDASITRQLEINLHGVIHGTREAMRRMVPRRTGHILNIGSVAGKAGFPHLATYSATKHGVIGLSEAARAELRGTGVEISVVMPVLVRTELTAGIAGTRVRTITPEEVAEAVIATLKVPAFDVFVPRSVGALVKVAALLPRRAREALSRALRSDQMMVQADRAARRAYEARAAASAPAVEDPDAEPGAPTPA